MLSLGYLEKPIVDVVFAHIFLVLSIHLISLDLKPGTPLEKVHGIQKLQERVSLQMTWPLRAFLSNTDRNKQRAAVIVAEMFSKQAKVDIDSFL